MARKMHRFLPLRSWRLSFSLLLYQIGFRCRVVDVSGVRVAFFFWICVCFAARLIKHIRRKCVAWAADATAKSTRCVCLPNASPLKASRPCVRCSGWPGANSLATPGNAYVILLLSYRYPCEPSSLPACAGIEGWWRPNLLGRGASPYAN